MRPGEGQRMRENPTRASRLLLRSALLGILAISGAESGEIPGGVTDLSWLAGCWQNVSEGTVSEEQWTKPAGGTMLGTSRTVRGEETLWYEFLQIRQEGDSVLYVARPSGQEGGVFVMTSLDSTAVVFENPAHDFPRRIIYRRAGADSLDARIEGVVAGGPRTEHFPLRRVRCD
jgi:hypothetical protein